MGICCSTEASNREKNQRAPSIGRPGGSPIGFSRVRRPQDHGQQARGGNEVLERHAVSPPPPQQGSTPKNATRLTAALLNPFGRRRAADEERTMRSNESVLSGETSATTIMPPPADQQTAVYRQGDDMLSQPSLSSSSVFMNGNTPKSGRGDSFIEDQPAGPAQVS